MEKPSQSSREGVPGYLSVREAAKLLGVSERSVYGYIETGRLPGERIEKSIMVSVEDVHAFKRRAPGRVRTTTPLWRRPPEKNPLYLTMIRARILPECGELLDNKLAEFRTEGKHYLTGTSARYIGLDQRDPNMVNIVLTWRSSAMPSGEQRQSALAALYADLAGILDWETAMTKNGQVLLHAE